MNRYVLLIFFFSIGYSQAKGLALYGLGEEIRDTDPSSLALGNSSFFTGNSITISTGSPSTLWRSALTRFTIHSGMNYLTNPQFPKQFHHNLTNFSLTFPIGTKKVFGFGLTPAFRTNRLEIEEDFQYIGVDESNTDIPTAYKSRYFVDGGVSELFLQYSQKWTPHFSFGIEYSFLFGNQFIDDELYTYDVFIDTVFSSGLLIDAIPEDEDTLYVQAINENMTRVKRSHQFSGIIFTLESRYTLPYQEWVLRASINGGTKVLTEITQTLNNALFTNNFYYTESMSISAIELGYHYQLAEHFGLIMEVHKNYALNIPEEVALFNIMPPDEHSLHLGMYYQLKNPKFGYWNSVNLRGGGYLKQLDFAGDKYSDYGFTFGLGIEYLANTQALDFALRAGKRNSFIIIGEDEHYLSFHIGITTGEKWFMKRRRK